MNKIASVTYIPACWCYGNKGYDIETKQYLSEDPKVTAKKKKLKRIFVFCNGRWREVRCGKFFFRLFGFTVKDKDLVLKKITKASQRLNKLCTIYSKLLEVEREEE